MILKNGSKTAPYNGAIWDEFSEQYQHQSTKKKPYSMTICTLGENLMHILVEIKIDKYVNQKKDNL